MVTPKVVGILSCSGEEFPGGTVSRIATRQVLDDLLPEKSTTICVPLFLAGDDQEQDFVKKFPCITVDGCDRRCAARSIENLGKTPMKEFVIDTFFTSEEVEEIKASSRHDLAWKDHPYCKKLANAIANTIK
jgi:uncharacterized metal-binding protein